MSHVRVTDKWGLLIVNSSLSTFLSKIVEEPREILALDSVHKKIVYFEKKVRFMELLECVYIFAVTDFLQNISLVECGCSLPKSSGLWECVLESMIKYYPIRIQKKCSSTISSPFFWQFVA